MHTHAVLSRFSTLPEVSRNDLLEALRAAGWTERASHVPRASFLELHKQHSTAFVFLYEDVALFGDDDPAAETPGYKSFAQALAAVRTN